MKGMKMNRYFVDCVTEVAISEDQSVVSLTCGSFDKEQNPQADFQIVMPRAAFLSLSNFFEGLNEKLGIKPETPEVSKTTVQKTEKLAEKTPKTMKTGSRVRKPSKKS